jgi:AsmA protein
VRAVKLVLLSCAALVGLLLICIALLVGFFNPNHYKHELEAWVKAQTGRAFTLQGDLDLKLFPAVALTAPHFVLSDAPQFGAQPLLQAQRVAVRLQLLPLLQGQVSFGELVLDGVQVHLTRTPSGETNWQDFVQQLTQRTQANSSSESGSGRGTGLRFDTLRDFTLNDAAVTFDDQQRGVTYQLQGLQLHTQNVSLRQPFAITGAVRFARAAQWQTQWHWRGKVMLDSEQRRYAATDLQVSVKLTGTAWPVAGVPIEFTTPSVELNQATHTAVLKSFTLQVAGAQLAGEMTARSLATQPQLDTRLRLAPLALREWAERMGKPLPVTRDRQVLNSVAAQWNLQASMNTALLEIEALTLDETTLTGQVQVSDFAQPQIRFTLHADQLNVDRYLAPAEPNATPTPAPLDWLRSLKVRGTLQIERAQLQGIRLQHLALQVDDE